MRILVADDQSLWRQRLSEILIGWGYEAVCVENGARALDVLRADPDIAVLMTDWVMPELDGIELCRRVRQAERHRYLPIILLTSRDGRDDLIAGLDAGADAFVRKPVNELELQAQIHVVERILKLEDRLDGQIAELKRSQARVDRDLANAAAIQRALLPRAAPEVPGVEFAWFYQACKHVGGDMFNVFRLSDECVGVYVLDVSGHGTSAALHSVSLNHALNPFPELGGIAKKAVNGSLAIARPCEVAEELNRRFPLIEQSGQYLTFLYGILELRELRFRYVRAGHPGPIHVSRSVARVREDGGNIPIGVMADVGYQDQEIRLEPGDGLMLLTDGVNETLDAEGEEFGIERVLDAASRTACRSMTQAVDSLRAELDDFRKLAPQRDDITIVGLRTGPADAYST